MNQHNRVYVYLSALLGVLRTWFDGLYQFQLKIFIELTKPLFHFLLNLHQPQAIQSVPVFYQSRFYTGRPSFKYITGLVLLLLLSVFMLSHASGLQIKITGDKTQDSVIAEILKEPSVLLKEPTTGMELFNSAVLMTDYGRLDLAADYVKKLNEIELSDEDLLAIRKAQGTAGMLKLLNTPETQAEARKFAAKMDAAFDRKAHDPAHIKSIIADLWEKPAKRNAAIIELRRLGKLALPLVINSWRKETDADRKTQLQAVISNMGHHVIVPLRDALTTDDAELQAMLIDALGRIGQQEAVQDLRYYAVNPELSKGVQAAAVQAIRRIYNRQDMQFSVSETVKVYSQLAEHHFANKHIWPLNDQGKVETWYWDEQGILADRYIQPRDASVETGIKYARQALELDVSNANVQALYLGLLLTRDGYLAGWGQELKTGKDSGWDQLLLAGPERVEDVLHLSLKYNRTVVAIPAIKAYAQLVPPEKFVYSNSPLIEALNYPDQRVQFMTAKTFLRAYPKSSFKYSSRLMEIVKQNLTDNADNAVLIIDPNESRSVKMAFGMQTFGYQGVSAKTGKDGFKRCANGENISLVLVHCNSIDWDASQTISNFKADARTKFLPILIIAPDHLSSRYERIYQNDPSIGIIPEAQDNKYFKSLITPFLANLPTPGLSATEKVAHTREALQLVKELAERTESAFNVNSLESNLIIISSNPRLTKDTIPVLANIGTKNSQEKLAYLTLSITLEMDVRKLAAAALTENIRKHGNLLPAEIVQELKKNWHDEGDQNLRSLLSAIMGLQQLSDKQLGERLLNKPPVETLSFN